MCHPRQEMAQLSQVPQIENGKPDFSPTFQKVELRNSTFFQLTNLFVRSFYMLTVEIHDKNGKNAYSGNPI